MDSVGKYKKRRRKRLLERFDADTVDWITMKNGEHVPLEDGKAVGGPMEGKDFSDAKSVDKKSGGAGSVKRPKPRKQTDVPDWYLNDEGKVKKAYLEEFNQDARKSIIEETGYTPDEAERFHDAILDFCGGNYSAYASGYRDREIKIIEDGLARMGAYDGDIYRGMFFDSSQNKDVDKFADLKVGDELKMRTISSWSSEKWVAEDFADDRGGTQSSVIITCRGNKSGVGVQHISKFATSEAEVLSPSTARWKVTGNKTMSKYDYLMSVAPSDRMRDWYNSGKETLEKFRIVLLDVEEI